MTLYIYGMEFRVLVSHDFYVAFHLMIFHGSGIEIMMIMVFLSSKVIVVINAAQVIYVL